MLPWLLTSMIVPLLALSHSQNSKSLVQQHPASENEATEEWLKFLKRPFMSWVPLNSSCISSKGRDGRCTFQATCFRQRGVVEGWCVKPVQICCVASLSCGGETRQNNSYFVNPDYPSSTDLFPSNGCHTEIWYNPRDVCQIRLELEIFDLAPPTEGKCHKDFLAVSGCNHNTFLPVICGRNNGQHLIVDVSSVPGPVALCLTLNGANRRVWRIKVIYLGCRHPKLAPKGCIQFFLEPLGSFFSFNFDGPSGQKGYMNNLNYAICLRRNAHYCGFTVTADHFSIGPNSSVVTTDGSCMSDFIQFPPGRVIVGGDSRPTPARICGSVFGCLTGYPESHPVTIDTQGPLAIYFNSEGSGPKGSGFKFHYIMNPCLVL